MSADDEPGHLQLNYIKRFGCIGPDCEDHCCHTWRVDVDNKSYEKLMMAAGFMKGEFPDKLKKLFRKLPPRKDQKTGKRKPPPRWVVKMDSSGKCPLLTSEGWCNLHGNLGFEFLPDVCAIYPRKVAQIGDHLELTAVVSCPETARQLLLHEDGADVVPWDPAESHRLVKHMALDTRDIRPYLRLLVRLRDFMVTTLKNHDYTLEQRLFFMMWFAKRTAPLLNLKDSRDTTAEIMAELAKIENPAVREEIAGRLAQLETPHGMALMVARAVVMPGPMNRPRRKFVLLLQRIFGSYRNLQELLDAGEEGPPHGAMTETELWDEYRRRRDKIRERFADRVDGYLERFSVYFWFNRNPIEADDLMTFTLRLLTEMSVFKFLLYSHPDVQIALRDAESDDEARDALDRAAVEVLYQIGRNMEHGPMMNELENRLEERHLRSLAGAVYLARF